MAKRFEKSLLICSDRHSLFSSLKEILGELSGEVAAYDTSATVSRTDSLIQSQALRMPYSIRAKWETSFQRRVNNELLAFIRKYKPDLVTVYNSEFLLPETCAEIKSGSKLVFYLADSPFYTPQNNYYLTVLSYADLILSPDTFWSKQLNTIGLANTLYFIPAPDRSYFSRITDRSSLGGVPETEVLYVGSSYFNSWGYKKALLMSRFVGFNFHLYGNSMWKRWFRFFPELEAKYTESKYIPTERLNRMFNMAKLIPVDGNPGILNGFHLRTFEALNAGALPLIEYREDLDRQLFNGCGIKLPLITDYSKAGEVAGYYLKNENERRETVDTLIGFIMRKYEKTNNAELLSEALGRGI